MAKRKQSQIGMALYHPANPCNQKFNVHPRPGKKRRTWWNGFGTNNSDNRS